MIKTRTILLPYSQIKELLITRKQYQDTYCKDGLSYRTLNGTPIFYRVEIGFMKLGDIQHVMSGYDRAHFEFGARPYRFKIDWSR